MSRVGALLFLWHLLKLSDVFWSCPPLRWPHTLEGGHHQPSCEQRGDRSHRPSWCLCTPPRCGGGIEHSTTNGETQGKRLVHCQLWAGSSSALWCLRNTLLKRMASSVSPRRLNTWIGEKHERQTLLKSSVVCMYGRANLDVIYVLIAPNIWYMKAHFIQIHFFYLSKKTPITIW